MRVAPAPSTDDAAPVRISSWPRMGTVAWGCLLERDLHHRDARFHCGAEPGPPGDPCKATDAYHAGPSFPAELSARVHPLAPKVTLTWEHGELQMVTLAFAAPVTEAAVRADLGLPPPGATLPANMTRLWLADDGKTLMIEGFDHMGAGDVECGD